MSRSTIPLFVAPNISFTTGSGESSYVLPEGTTRVLMQVITNDVSFLTETGGALFTLVKGNLYILGPDDNLSKKRLYFDDLAATSVVQLLIEYGPLNT